MCSPSTRPSKIAIGISLLVAMSAICNAFAFNPKWLLEDWTDTNAVPFEVNDKLEIATAWKPLKRSSASLLCGPTGPSLMLKSKLKESSSMRPSTSYDLSTNVIFFWQAVSGRKTSETFETNSMLLKLGSIDTVVTAPLTESDQSKLISWFKRGTPQNLSFTLSERAVHGLQPVVSLNQIQVFFQECNNIE